jgi:hypothetical protein
MKDIEALKISRSHEGQKGREGKGREEKYSRTRLIVIQSAGFHYSSSGPALSLFFFTQFQI